MQSPKLSILIPSTYDREEMTENLVDYLNKMAAGLSVHVHTYYDDKEISVGKKRQELLEDAKGEYVVFIDSDDWVPEYYIDELLKAFETSPDCVGFEIAVKGMRGKLASASNMWGKWENKRKKYKHKKYDYVRTPYHKNPIKREIAIQIGFKDMRYAEDIEFSDRLKKSGLIKTEVYIQKPMYEYRYKYEPAETKYGYDKDGLESK